MTAAVQRLTCFPFQTEGSDVVWFFYAISKKQASNYAKKWAEKRFPGVEIKAKEDD